MASNQTNQSEFAIGIILVCVGALLLYTQYNVGYWGVLALGFIFIVKNLSFRRKENDSSKVVAVEKDRRSDRINK
jgi:hypothetical protein